MGENEKEADLEQFLERKNKECENEEIDDESRKTGCFAKVFPR